MNDVPERVDDIGIIALDPQPVYAPDARYLQELMASVERLGTDPSLNAFIVVINGKPADTEAELGRLAHGEHDPVLFRSLLNRIEMLERPVIAALQGEVCGASLELALACHFRIASADCRMGFPEVTMGLIPAGMGTQRLPRLVGPEQALDMLLRGKQVDAGAAMKIGLIQAIAGADLLASGVRHARLLQRSSAAISRTRTIAVAGGVRQSLLEQAMGEAGRRDAANPAPRRIVRCIEASLTGSFDEGCEVEAGLSAECRESAQSRALRYLHLAGRKAVVIPQASGSIALRDIRSVGIVGAGTMGGGIAMNFANAGIPTVIVETSVAALERGLNLVRGNYEASAAKGRLTAEQVAQRMALLQGSLDYSDLAGCDLVIEAVFENMDIKKQVCARLGDVCKPGAIIASNTSTLDVDELALTTGRPSDVLGMHFFSPAHVMRLLEVVRGARTDAGVLATVMRLAGRIGKVPVVSGVCYGFIGNRMLEPYLRESEFLLMEGASPAQIDGAIEALGFAMGPCRMLDMAGLDVGAKVVLERGKAGGLPPDPSYRAVVRRMHELGRHGQKTGLGYYRYEGRKALPDPALQSVCEELAVEHGITRRSDISDQEIVERCLYPLMNEGARILEEGIAYRPSDIDIVWTQGYGFPDYRGGPVFMADQIGLRTVVERLKHYAQVRGNVHDYWSVSALLGTLCERNARLADWTP
jgi:3-hydroxyacyl-CoA dehydrogenase